MKTLTALALFACLAGTASAGHFRRRAAVVVSPVVVRPVVVGHGYGANFAAPFVSGHAAPVVAGYSACGSAATLVTPQVGTVAAPVVAPVVSPVVSAVVTPTYGVGTVSAFSGYGHSAFVSPFVVRHRAFVAAPVVAVRSRPVVVGRRGGVLNPVGRFLFGRRVVR